MDKKKTWLPGSSALALLVGLPPILPELHNIPGLQYRECLSVPLTACGVPRPFSRCFQRAGNLLSRVSFGVFCSIKCNQNMQSFSVNSHFLFYLSSIRFDKLTTGMDMHSRNQYLQTLIKHISLIISFSSQLAFSGVRMRLAGSGHESWSHDSAQI